MLRENPLKSARSMLGLTINQVAASCQIHRQVIIRAEQGCYASIPPRLHTFLVGRLGEGDPPYPLDYKRWVAEKRGDSFGKLNQQLPGYSPEVHPFTQWREASELNRTETCVLFCVHPSTVLRFESKLFQQSVPDQLCDALEQAGYSAELIQELMTRYKIFRRIKLAEKSGIHSRISNARAIAEEHRRMIAA